MMRRLPQTSRCVCVGLVVHFTAALASQCRSDAACAHDCRDSLLVSGLTGQCEVSCNALYKRCVCAGSSALRIDGSCTDQTPEKGSQSCEPAYSTLFNAAVFSSPELDVRHMFVNGTGSLSPPAATIFTRAFSSAMTIPTGDVRIIRVRYVPLIPSAPDNVTDGAGKLLHFDLELTLCSVGAAIPDLQPRDFEYSVRLEVQKYSAFSMATVRMLHLIRLAGTGNVGSTDTPSGDLTSAGSDRSSTPAPDQADAHSWSGMLPTGGLDKEDSHVDAALLCFSVSCVILTGAFGVLIYRIVDLRRREKHWVMQQLDWAHDGFAQPIGFQFGDDCDFNVPRSNDQSDCVPGHLAEETEVSLACAVTAYFPDEGCVAGLCLEKDDIIEVVASAGKWMFGKVVGCPEREGSFPKCCVEWLEPSGASGREHLDGHGTREPCGAQTQHEDDPSDSERLQSCCAQGAYKPSEHVICSDGSAAVMANEAAEGQPEHWQHPVSPLCAAPEATEPGGVWRHEHQGFVAEAVANFLEHDVPGQGTDETMLWLSRGDVVKVAAGSDGWLYGEVVGVPGRRGYFPENRVVWLHLSATVELPGDYIIELS
eukprot:TRINITY_DN28402_c0_g1_i3.p1 TRINITY_DN28402_c0_g1~~TRINITY_DN28402_c0_g1_i3.p1  ORF type:complete len:594 (+),score=21.19 TRINITY_DN28402_c0_g1_i3:20-1801(+)